MTDGDGARTPGASIVVLAPDVVGGLWLDPACGAVFEAWRDEKLRPAVNRDLLVRYVRLWRSLGLGEIQVRRWSWWFTAPGHSLFLAEDQTTASNAIECCSRLAVVSAARWIIHRGTVRNTEGGIVWLTAGEFARPGAHPK
jgi:hypothetical protein